MAKTKSRMLLLFLFIGSLWLIEAVDLMSGHALDHYGALQPRTSIGLAQIFSSPFLHGDFWHLFSNTLALIPLGILMVLEGGFLPVALLAMVIGGLGTWLFSSATTLGFSGVLFGFMGYLMARGFYQRKPLSIVLSLLTLSWFGGSALWGLIPHGNVSWAGHFWGLVGGILAARFLKK